MVELVEKIIVDTHSRAWIALSIGGCGILARAFIGRHLREEREDRSLALEFAYHVLHAIGFSFSHERVITPQILVDVADVVIRDPEHVGFICTTWQCLPEKVEICSVGSCTVLAFEGDTIQKVIAPHNVNELLQSQGTQLQMHESVRGGIVTHVLGSKSNKGSCSVDDVKVARIPLLPTTTIAMIEHWQLAEDIMQRAVPANELLSFIESWDLLAKRVRTSVLISLVRK